MDAQTTTILTELRNSVAEMRDANDRRFAEIAAKGHASAETVAQVERANTSITDLTAQLDTVRKALRDMETEHARALPGDASKLTDLARNEVRTFVAQSKGKRLTDVEDVTNDDVAALRDYRKAFNAYLAQGNDSRVGRTMSSDLMNTLQTGSQPNGGFMVTPDRIGRIVTMIVDESPILDHVTTETIGGDALEGDLDMDEDVGAGWVGETEVRPETTSARGPGEYRIPLMEIYAAPTATQKQLDTADRDVGAWYEKKIARKFGRVIQPGVHTGAGGKQIRGFLNYSSVGGKPASTSLAAWQVIETVKTGVNNAFAATAPGDKLIDLVNLLHPSYRANASFFMSRLTVAEVRKLKDGQGNYLWVPNFSQRSGGLLLDYGIVEDEGMPGISTTAATANAIAFGDMKQCYTLVKHTTGMRILRDAFTNKPKVIFYTTEYVGGDVVDYQAIKLLRFQA